MVARRVSVLSAHVQMPEVLVYMQVRIDPQSLSCRSSWRLTIHVAQLCRLHLQGQQLDNWEDTELLVCSFLEPDQCATSDFEARPSHFS